MRKLVVLLVLCFCLLAAGCGGSTSGSADKGELNLYVWTQYIPDSVIKQFEEKYGIKVNVSNYTTNEECLAKLESSPKGTYDIVVPGDFMIKIMKEKHLLQKLDKEKIPNIKNVYKTYLNQYYDPGNEYSVPYQTGTVLLAVNTDKIKEPITSYADLIKPQYKNSIVSIDEQRVVIGIALKALGYSINTIDDAKLAQAKAFLQKLMPNIKVFDGDSPKSEMISGETSIGLIYNAEAALAQKQNPAIKIIYPKEGMYRFIDNFAIPAGAKNKANAELFINFILEPKIAAEITKVYPYTSVNEAAKTLLPKDYTDNKASNIPVDVMDKGEFVKDVGANTPKFDQIWSEVKSQK
ncbi:polyamine ABC transporter substrate-binding protein [Pectinatus sottacetonis]|uniref:polyamine ABC transporter substrate-binding protein n=1 Tax=Pectinatus sottacetonis TaxID=1002795 RepID=UPI0018C70A11|nr:spermidine/putrescine ABC transporter substrate-binding protein [Pectinatus sottacetonis]